MALTSVKILLERLSALAAEEVKLLGGLEREVNEIKAELETMRSFLQDAEARSETDQGVKTWVKQVRDVAYDAEDVLDEFLLRVAQPQSQGGIINFLHYSLRYLKHLRTRHRLASQIQDINIRIKAISERRKTYAFNIMDQKTTLNATSNEWRDPRIAALYIDEAEVVGIENPKNLLIGWLTEGEPKLTAISVVGMGGLGKTTLVKKAYDSQSVKGHFDCHAWITVSQSFAVGELLRTAIKEFFKATNEAAPGRMDTMDEGELIGMLKKYLHPKRYVIIFDDVWNSSAWDAIKYALPNCNRGSRVVFTTRSADFAASVETTSHVYNLQPLPEPAAWRLFCMKASRTNNVNSCSKELKKLSLSILKKCGGLPLAIVTIGGLLAKKDKTMLEWKKIHDSLGAEMRTDYNLQSIGRILLLSYNNLPYYLKPCYLYLSIFPEDHLIKRAKLIRLWIAEGLVEEKQGLTVEEVAEDYLNELISRSMIQVAEKSISNEVKSCRIHDLMREIIQSKSREECFTAIVGLEGMELHDNARRISIHNISVNYSLDTTSLPIRSLTLFTLDESPHSFQHEFFHAFRLLRVLDLEGAHLVRFPPGLVKLVHLRYLSLKRTMIDVLPTSVGKLKNIETLDLKHTNVSVLPAEIFKLQRLRHLFVYRDYYDLHKLSLNVWGMTLCKGIGSLSFLQSLCTLDVEKEGYDIVVELRKLTQLRRLSITNLKWTLGGILCFALMKMKHLNSLSVISSEKYDEYLKLDSLQSPPQLLCHLSLTGRLYSIPVWITSLGNLIRLSLRNSNLNVDPLKAFQNMPNLVFLELNQAYNGKELCCYAGGYPRLKTLTLAQLGNLETVSLNKASMPRLQQLEIIRCRSLMTVPWGIENLIGLQELSLLEMPFGFSDKIRKPKGEDCWKVEHISTIKNVRVNSLGEWITENLNDR